jgi:hypothetical protein
MVYATRPVHFRGRSVGWVASSVRSTLIARGGSRLAVLAAYRFAGGPGQAEVPCRSRRPETTRCSPTETVTDA